MSLPELIQLRHFLHQYPERSGQEKQTAARVNIFVQAFNPTKIIEGVGGNGLAVIYEFQEPGAVVMIRCELDALPILEKNDFSHRSRNEGISHKCGHDGHCTIVAGLAAFLEKSSDLKGTVILLFQPAEENGTGAALVLKDLQNRDLHPDYVFALHNLPGLPMHQIQIFPAQFSPSVQSVAIKLTGKTAHAAEPENGRNPALAVAEIIQTTAALIISKPERQDFTQITPVYIQAGQKDYGLSAGYGEVHFTMRAWQKERLQTIIAKIQTQVQAICTAHQLAVAYDWFDYFPTVHNDPICNQIIQKVAQSNDLKWKIAAVGCKFGEDFGWFSQTYKAAMFGIGAGTTTPALHHDDYDFPDELIPTGIAMFKDIIKVLLSS